MRNRAAQPSPAPQPQPHSRLSRLGDWYVHHAAKIHWDGHPRGTRILQVGLGAFVAMMSVMFVAALPGVAALTASATVANLLGWGTVAVTSIAATRALKHRVGTVRNPIHHPAPTVQAAGPQTAPGPYQPVGANFGFGWAPPTGPPAAAGPPPAPAPPAPAAPATPATPAPAATPSAPTTAGPAATPAAPATAPAPVAAPPAPVAPGTVAVTGHPVPWNPASAPPPTNWRPPVPPPAAPRPAKSSPATPPGGPSTGGPVVGG